MPDGGVRSTTWRRMAGKARCIIFGIKFDLLLIRKDAIELWKATRSDLFQPAERFRNASKGGLPNINEFPLNEQAKNSLDHGKEDPMRF